MRKHLIEQHNLGEKVVNYSLGGLSYSQIAEKLEREHGLKLSKASICRWLAKHGETVAVVQNERTNEGVTVTIDGVKKLISEVLQDVERRLPEFESDPKALVPFLRLKLDAIDRVARLTGAYGDGVENQINVAVRVDHASDPKCEGCPLIKFPEGTTFQESMKIWEDYFESIETEVN